MPEKEAEKIIADAQEKYRQSMELINILAPKKEEVRVEIMDLALRLMGFRARVTPL